jgi:hypothetical protein
MAPSRRQRDLPFETALRKRASTAQWRRYAAKRADDSRLENEYRVGSDLTDIHRSQDGPGCME